MILVILMFLPSQREFVPREAARAFSICDIPHAFRVFSSRAGKGELSGLVANLRAAMVVIAAPIFGRVSLSGRASGLPGAPLLAVAVITVSTAVN
eukprot:COSAG05_NODE_2191_length_3420_cov_2.271906_3_plen_95_part_00